MTSAALIVVVVAGSFAFADIVLIKAARARRGDRGGDRRDDRPGPARAGHDAPARASGTGGCRRACGAGWRTGSRRRVETEAPLTAAGVAAPAWRPPALRRSPGWRRSPASWRSRRCAGPDPGQPAGIAATRAADATPAPSPAADPRADPAARATTAPHDRLTEWWYYTGHLRDAAERRTVRLRVRRSSGPSAAASRSPGRRTSRSPTRRAATLPLRPAERDRAAGRPAARARPAGVRRWRLGPDPTDPARAGRPAWTMAGGDGTRPARAAAVAGRGGDGRVARRARARPGARTPPSRPSSTTATAGSTSGRPAARTTTRGPTLAGDRLDRRRRADAAASTATAWFDHQWGDFIAVGGGGWDWFAVNLDDGTDLTLSLVRAADGTLPARLRHARRRGRAGRRHLDRSAFSVTATGHWTIARHAGPTYPAGWTVSIPGQALEITPPADRRRPGARHAGDDRGRLLGGLAGRPGDAGGARPRRRGLRRADRLRPLGAGGLAGIVRRLAAASASIADRVVAIEPRTSIIRFAAACTSRCPSTTRRARRAPSGGPTGRTRRAGPGAALPRASLKAIDDVAAPGRIGCDRPDRRGCSGGAERLGLDLALQLVSGRGKAVLDRDTQAQGRCRGGWDRTADQGGIGGRDVTRGDAGGRDVGGRLCGAASEGEDEREAQPGDHAESRAGDDQERAALDRDPGDDPQAAPVAGRLDEAERAPTVGQATRGPRGAVSTGGAGGAPSTSKPWYSSTVGRAIRLRSPCRTLIAMSWCGLRFARSRCWRAAPAESLECTARRGARRPDEGPARSAATVPALLTGEDVALGARRRRRTAGRAAAPRPRRRTGRMAHWRSARGRPIDK